MLPRGADVARVPPGTADDGTRAMSTMSRWRRRKPGAEAVVMPAVEHGLWLESFQRLYGLDALTIERADEFSLSRDEFLHPSDPTSAVYRASVLDDWRRITQRSDYEPAESESFDVDLGEHLPRPFPFTTRDPSHISHYLGAVASGDRPPTVRPSRESRRVRLRLGSPRARLCLSRLPDHCGRHQHRIRRVASHPRRASRYRSKWLTVPFSITTLANPLTQ